MHRKVMILFTLFVLFLFSTVVFAAPQMLIRIDRSVGIDLPFWTMDAIKVVVNGEGYITALCAPADYARLVDADLDVRILDPQSGGVPYYRADRLDLQTWEGRHTVKWLDSDDHSVLLKLDDAQAEAMLRQGIRMVRLFDHGLPIVDLERAGQQTRIQTAPVDLIDQVLAELSDSSFFALVARLQAFKTRYVYSDSTVPARNWIELKFREFGYDDVAMDSFELGGTTQRNVFATKHGTQDNGRVIVVGGHYDSIVSNRQIAMVNAPGADDNATGAAGAMELARALAGVDLESTVIFIAFAGEELGLWGSYYYALNAYQTGLDIDVMLNMDMIGNVSDTYPDVNILTDLRSTAFANLARELTTDFTSLQPVIGNSGSASDHYYFQQFGYPALFFQEGDFSPVYHSTSDIIDYVDADYATEVLKVVAATIIQVANSPRTPQGLQNLEPGDGATQIIRWAPNNEADLLDYVIHVGRQSGSYEEFYRLSIVENPEITLYGLTPGETYYLAVSAMDSEGNYSMLSEELVFTPQAAPRMPVGLVSTSKRDCICLQWENTNNELDFAGYVLYRIAAGEAVERFELPLGQSDFEDRAVHPNIRYTYTLVAVDSAGNESQPSQAVFGQLATHDQGILLVDGSKNGNDRPLMPSDASVDLYYEQVLQGFKVAKQWDLQDSVLVGVALNDAELGQYSTVIYHSEVASPPRSLAADTVALKKYLDNGGSLILSGWSLLDNLSGVSNPSKVFSPSQFAYEYLGVVSASTGDGSLRDFSGAEPVIDGYPIMDVDPAKAAAFNGNLLAMEIVTNRQDDEDSEPLYSYRSSADPVSAFHGQPIALRYGNDSYRVALFNFPLFFMKKEQAQTLLTTVLQEFGEQSTAVEQTATGPEQVPQQFDLGQNYPNPFNPVTRIPVAVPYNSHVRLAIYDLIGRLTAVIHDGPLPAGRHELTWDAHKFAAGIYFCKLESDHTVGLRKLVLLK